MAREKQRTGEETSLRTGAGCNQQKRVIEVSARWSCTAGTRVEECFKRVLCVAAMGAGSATGQQRLSATSASMEQNLLINLAASQWNQHLQSHLHRAGLVFLRKVSSSAQTEERASSIASLHDAPKPAAQSEQPTSGVDPPLFYCSAPS